MIWNVINDWSLLSNPFGAWSCGYKTEKLGAFNIFNKVGNETNRNYENYKGWYELETWDRTPYVMKNGEDFTTFGVLPGEITMHPGDGGKWTVIRWIAEADATVNLKGSFKAGDGAWITYSIIKNNSEVIYNINSGNTENFDINLNVTAGDTLDFQVGDGYSYGNTPINFTISDGVVLSKNASYRIDSEGNLARIRNSRILTDGVLARNIRHKLENGNWGGVTI